MALQQPIEQQQSTNQQQQQAPNLIAEYAVLMHQIDRCRNAGIKVHESWYNRAQELERIAQTRLTPEQQWHAQQYVLQERERLTQADRLFETEQKEAAKSHAIRRHAERLTRNSAGGTLAPEQLADVLEGKTTKVRNPDKARLNLKELDKLTREQTGMSVRKREQLLDDLAETYSVDKTRALAKADAAGIDAETLRRWWAGEGLEFGLQRRAAERTANEPDEVEFKLEDEHDERKYDLANSMFASDPQGSLFDNDYSRLQTMKKRYDDEAGDSGDSMRSDIAGAFLSNYDNDPEIEDEV